MTVPSLLEVALRAAAAALPDVAQLSSECNAAVNLDARQPALSVLPSAYHIPHVSLQVFPFQSRRWCSGCMDVTQREDSAYVRADTARPAHYFTLACSTYTYAPA
jgi:hypothetical protein